MIERLILGEQIYQSPFKSPGEGTYEAEYMSQDVIVKRGGARLIHEAEVLRSADHDTIPKLLDFSQIDDTCLMVMSRLVGTPLSDLIGLQPDWTSLALTPGKAVTITQQVASAFRAVRNAGYIYRDLNLGHIMVADGISGLCDHEADVELGDAGIGQVDTLSGTWETMAPEEFTLGNSITEASSTYTLGVLLLQLVAGNNPYHVANTYDMHTDEARESVYRLHSEAVEINTGFGAFDTLITKALAPAPQFRYQTLADIEVALDMLPAEE